MLPAMSVLYNYCTSILKTMSFLVTVTVKKHGETKTSKKLKNWLCAASFPKGLFI